MRGVFNGGEGIAEVVGGLGRRGVLSDTEGREEDKSRESKKTLHWVNTVVEGLEKTLLNSVVSQVSKSRSPPHGRRPVRGDPGSGAPSICGPAQKRSVRVWLKSLSGRSRGAAPLYSSTLWELWRIWS